MRQICKQILTIAALLAVLVVPGRADSLVTAIVTDPLTGVAMDGYDPVSYFTGNEPQPGLPDYEYDWMGVPWYFSSAANRDVFIRSPEIYAPQFGGHCLMSLSRGYLSDGKPRLYVVEALKLYFFYSSSNRDAFLLSKQMALTNAAANWDKLKGQLSSADAETPAAGAMSDVGDAADDITPSVAPDGTAGNVAGH